MDDSRYFMPMKIFEDIEKKKNLLRPFTNPVEQLNYEVILSGGVKQLLKLPFLGDIVRRHFLLYAGGKLFIF